MASRFWVGGVGTWDAADTTHWAATSGGAGGQSVPGSSDSVTFDGSSGGGTVTVDFGGTITIQALTMSAFTGTLDFATNNNNVTLNASGGFTSTGSGTRTLNMGSGTWTLSDNAALWNMNGATNFTFNANTSTIAFTGTGGNTARRFTMGSSRTYNVVTIASSTAPIIISGTTCTIGTLTIDAGNAVWLPNGNTTTVTTFTDITGSSSAQTLLMTDNPVFGRPTISSANNWTGTWCGFAAMVFAGGGTFSATDSFDFKGNSGITITAPSGGAGGGGQRVISG